NQVDIIQNQTELENFQRSITYRFGPMPEEVDNLIKLVMIRWKAERLQFEKLTLKNNIMEATFVSTGNDVIFNSGHYGKVIDYVKKNSAICSLKDFKGKLIFTQKDVNAVDQMDGVLSQMVE